VLARIQVLDSALADQIAAGEVVERPGSVVKELLENALDAHATRVVVEIEHGGQNLIRVTDDGHGMDPENARLCVQRHATSKIRSRDDLFAIQTLGFRGEALPSIASVSRFSLTTRPAGALAATCIEIEGGAAALVSERGSAPGTRVEVRDLFFNVPARLKFLKSRPTESAQVGSVCLRAALAHPHLALTLIRDGRTTQELVRAPDRLTRVRSIFPDEQLHTYEGEFEGVRMQAALGPPEKARSGATQLHLFVNSRPVRDTALARAIAYAYGSVMPPGRFPTGALYLELDPAEVDVNVHPQKLEVRFARGRGVLDALTRFLSKQLGTSAWSGPAGRAPSFWNKRPPGPDASHEAAARAAVSGSHATPYAAGATSSSGSPVRDPWDLAGGHTRASSAATVLPTDRVAEALAPFASREDATQGALTQAGTFAALRPLGQAQRMFLVCESQTGLVILDQHAADERVRFDRLARAYTDRSVKTQQLLFPERVECTELEALAVEEHHAELARAGLHCTRLGPTTVAVSAIPALLHRAATSRLLRDVLTQLDRSGERAFADAIDMALATMACHGAIRAGDALAHEEIAALLRALDEVEDFQGHCPHGRPVVCTLPFAELARQLGR
jgi:DNA mismatch repair protein MutL